MRERLYGVTGGKDDYLWREGLECTADGKGDLCTEHWIHAYRDPLLAVVMNPVVGEFCRPRLWEVEGDVGISDGLRVGCTYIKVLKQSFLPVIMTIKDNVRFAIYCALELYDEPQFIRWAQKWMLGPTRFAKGTEKWLIGSGSVSRAAKAAAKAASLAAKDVDDAAWTAMRAAQAAETLARADEAAAAWRAARTTGADAAAEHNAALILTWSAGDAVAETVETAMKTAARTGKTIDFIALVHKVIEEPQVAAMAAVQRAADAAARTGKTMDMRDIRALLRKATKEEEARRARQLD